MENNNLEAMSVPDIMKAIKNGTINPKDLDPDILKECVRDMRETGSRSSEIGRFLKMTPRHVFRYVGKIRKENTQTMSPDSQREFIWELINNFRAQYYRMIRISYLEDINNRDRISAITEGCKIQREIFSIMERFGYLDKQKNEEVSAKIEASDWDPQYDPLVAIADKLQPSQREKLLEFIRIEPGYTEEKLLKMAKLFIVENKKLGLYDADGNLQTNEPKN